MGDQIMRDIEQWIVFDDASLLCITHRITAVNVERSAANLLSEDIDMGKAIMVAHDHSDNRDPVYVVPAWASMLAVSQYDNAHEYLCSQRGLLRVGPDAGILWPQVVREMSYTPYTWDYEGEQWVRRVWIGTTLGTMPSGKVYTGWTSNQTCADVYADEYYTELLEEECDAHGFFLSIDDDSYSVAESDPLPAEGMIDLGDWNEYERQISDRDRANTDSANIDG